MKKRGVTKGALLFLFIVLLLGMSVNTSAASYKWKKAENGNMRCYKNGKLVKDQWVGNKHLNKKGYMDRNTWVEKEVNGETVKVFVRDDGKWVKNFKEGWQNINGKYYFYTKKGVLQTGWIKFKNKMYYVNPTTRTRVSGMYPASGSPQYFFSASGVLQVNKTFTYDGKKYTSDSRGVCTLVPDKVGANTDMLFFLTFESGSEAYDQTGGDRGNACGAYQFDNRFSLLPFVKYAFSQNWKLCWEFKKYANYYTDGTKLKSNTEFYEAWHKIYARDPKAFAELQDNYAKQEYYDPVERMLRLKGIDLSSRPGILKGSVFSYSIQHGQLEAVNAVVGCGITNATTDEKFLYALYKYRSQKHPLYWRRYYSERELALKKLRAAAAA